MQNIDNIRDFLSVLRLLIAFVKDSPKIQAIFNSLHAEQSATGPLNNVAVFLSYNMARKNCFVKDY